VSVDRQTIGTRKEAIPAACAYETVMDTLSRRSALEIVVQRIGALTMMGPLPSPMPVMPRMILYAW
jgi:hypothetical protein